MNTYDPIEQLTIAGWAAKVIDEMPLVSYHTVSLVNYKATIIVSEWWVTIMQNQSNNDLPPKTFRGDNAGTELLKCLSRRQRKLAKKELHSLQN